MKRLATCATLAVALVCLMTGVVSVAAQEDQTEDPGQVANRTYQPVVQHPTYEAGAGPAVYIDQAHHNFHTLDGRYRGFADLLIADGYRLEALDAVFSAESLEGIDVLVISNALNERNVEDWSLPTPSAFTPDEITAVRDWVGQGGSLFLIADHMPMPGAAADLAEAFGFTFYNGFALDTATGGDMLCRADATLADHVVTAGSDSTQWVDSVVSFTGQAFEIPERAVALTTLDDRFELMICQVAWEFDSTTVRRSADGLVQMAVLEFGKGRVAVSGEAAMFTAQCQGDRCVGMGTAEAPHNEQFLLNIVHWLDGTLK